MEKNNSIPRSKVDEQTGVDSAIIQQMVEQMSFNGIDIHSIMLIRNGKVACEGYGAPFSKDRGHMMYSVSKSFLATAYGFALAEGKVSRQTKLLDVYPELRPEKTDEKLEKLTLHHLITMTAGKQSSVKGVNKYNRLEAFVKQKWIFSPGEDWRYVNENYYVAAAMLSKVLGESITEYLTPRLYEPLGIEAPFWEKSADGIESGGYGLILKTEDFAKFVLCYSNNGIYNGKQVIPASWVSEATTKQADTSVVETHTDSAVGYGCGFWQCAGMDNTYRCEGMFCQFGIVFKDYDACLVMTSNESDLQKTLDMLWRYIPKAFSDNGSYGSTTLSLSSKTSVTVNRRSSIEKKINGSIYKMRKCRFVNAIGLPISIFPMPVVFFAHNHGGNMDKLKFEFDENGCLFSWDEDGNNKNTVYLGMSGEASIGKVRIGDLNLTTRSWAYWDNKTRLVMHVYPLEAVAERILVFEFRGNKLRMLPVSRPGTDEKAKKIGDKLKCVLTGRYFHTWIDILVPRVNKILNPVHYGKRLRK